jgi:hypothetical protein
MFMCGRLRALLVLAASAGVLSADQVIVDSYEISSAIMTGFGNYQHVYDGLITPVGGIINTGGVFNGQRADYTLNAGAGSGTLNDDVIASGFNGHLFTQLFVAGGATDSQEGPIQIDPSITLHLASSIPIGFINLYSLSYENSVSGRISAVDVTIGGQTRTIETVGFGMDNGTGFPVHDRIIIYGTDLAGLNSGTIVLSNFERDAGSTLISISEIDVYDAETPLPSDVPEPATMSLGGVALGALAFARRRFVR